ncbi:MAG: tyrosine--tRNA ligase [Candidatus Dormibacteraeota bacterium]|nr:tyrosine--tRNA ligase [Candidatus Dormibacteraeota bacterium]MBO0704960.1 tyrosine--tRNA ligase [Candidatus Dormibacteraeota bacterium]MBO0760894.1 tyrosine--tRNA ligase [Candidatus Dormibacteraeota bacterium]
MASSLWELLRSRAVEIHVAEHLEARLDRGEHLRVKLGMDPTAPDIHVGHLVVLDVLRACQDAGHTVVLIVGDFTALIGDPSGRSETRPVLTREEVDQNARTYFDQAYRVLDPERTEVHGNSAWLAELGAEGVLRLLGTQTLQEVLRREDFATRLREGLPVGAHEILYPFNQAYDSVAVRADVEIGGTDQLFNLLFGREVQRAYGQPPQDIMVFPLLEGTDGSQKMSKSLGNYIGISEPPREIYGKTMSIPDPLIEKYVRLISGLRPEAQDGVLALQPRDAKAALAAQLVRRLHGEGAARLAEEEFDRTFRRGEVDEDSVPELEVGPGTTVAQLLVEAGVAASFSKARRLADQGGVSVRGDKVAYDRVIEDGEVVRAGKRRFIRARVR